MLLLVPSTSLGVAFYQYVNTTFYVGIWLFFQRMPSLCFWLVARLTTGNNTLCVRLAKWLGGALPPTPKKLCV